MTSPQITLGSRVRKSPYFDSTIAAGATMFTVYNHMYMPTGYGDPDGEYQRLTTGVALWDVGAERQVEVTGPDALALANYVSARDLTSMEVGRARYAPMCDHQGRLLNDPVILRVDQDRYWISLADSDMLYWVRAIAGERGLDVTVEEPDVSPLAIQGPRAIELARDLFGADTVDPLGMFHHCWTEIDGIPLVLCRSGWSRQGGYELFLTDGSAGSRLWELVADAGEPYGIGPGTPNHQERIESGLLSWGSDHRYDTDPIEAGLAKFTSLSGDHDFVGRSALEARLQRPTRHNVVNVRLDGDRVPIEHPWPLLVAGNQVGLLRTATWSPRLQHWLGIAQIATPHDAPGVAFTVELPDGTTRAGHVHDQPFGETQH